MYSVWNQKQDLLEVDELEYVLILLHHYYVLVMILALVFEKQYDKFLQKKKIYLQLSHKINPNE